MRVTSSITSKRERDKERAEAGEEPKQEEPVRLAWSLDGMN